MPPGTGICHQVNLEYLGKTVFVTEENGEAVAYPDSLVGTDSHTTMINGLGVLGWGVGGIEAEAAMLGQPVSMLIPEVVGFKLHGKLPPGATATDLVLTVTEMLRKKKVVGKFVEFYGTGLSSLPLADRATIANMAPEYGATMGFFPVDEETLKYLRLSGRPRRSRRARRGVHEGAGTLPHRRHARSGVHRHARARPRHRRAESRRPEAPAGSRAALEVEGDVPRRARRRPREARHARRRSRQRGDRSSATRREAAMAAALWRRDRRADAERREGASTTASTFTLRHGAVVIAAITSCTNTSNPSVMLAAGLLARNAVKKGLTAKPWVKTSLAPGSKVVTDYFNAPACRSISTSSASTSSATAARRASATRARCPSRSRRRSRTASSSVPRVLSGNRNFEGRVNPLTRFNYLASPPLVVAYALAGRMDLDLTREPIGVGKDGPVFLRDIWPTPQEVQDEVAAQREERVLQARSTPTSSRATSSGSRSTCRPARRTRGTRTRRT